MENDKINLMKTHKIGFLFGAGAEMGAGFPSGCEFSIEVFRYDKYAKQKVNDRLEKIVIKDDYSNWLAKKNKISIFSGSSLKNVIKDSIEDNKDKVIKTINDFDAICAKQIKNYFNKRLLNRLIEKNIDSKLKELNKEIKISLSDKLGKRNDLFRSNYFLALYKLYINKKEQIEKNEVLNTEKGNFEKIRKIIVSVLQLLAATQGKKLLDDLNGEIIVGEKGRFKVIDDLRDIYKVDYKYSGVEGLEYLIKLNKTQIDQTYDYNNEQTIIDFYTLVLEDIYSQIISYKSLIDENWSYLYKPSKDWAKFTKMSCFLYGVQMYINGISLGIKEEIDNCPKNEKNILIKNKFGYYYAIREAIKDRKVKISEIATTNYSPFDSEVIRHEVQHLNGSSSMYFDPYLNKVYDGDPKNNHFVVPMMFTQSGTKPMTSIDVSKKYVDTYNKWKKYDNEAVIIIGFGFNEDDEHIITIIRTLIQEDKKPVYVVDLSSNTEWNKKIKILRIHNKSNLLRYVKVNEFGIYQGKEKEEINWLDYILNDLEKNR